MSLWHWKDLKSSDDAFASEYSDLINRWYFLKDEVEFARQDAERLYEEYDYEECIDRRNEILIEANDMSQLSEDYWVEKQELWDELISLGISWSSKEEEKEEEETVELKDC